MTELRRTPIIKSTTQHESSVSKDANTSVRSDMLLNKIFNELVQIKKNQENYIQNIMKEKKELEEMLSESVLKKK